MTLPDLRKASVHMTLAQKSFIEDNFRKRECVNFIPSSKNQFDSQNQIKCGCGRPKSQHSSEVIDSYDGHCRGATNKNVPNSFGNGRWSIQKHTEDFATDAYGTIEFQGGPHPHKAQYVRLGFDSEPEAILHLFEYFWGIERPKLVISVHGGIANFNLQPKLARAFRKGLLKAAKTTGAWIITSGLNAGVVRHVSSALTDGGGLRAKKKIVTIGVAPWGLLGRGTREEFNKRDATVQYHPQAHLPGKGRLPGLSDKHSYFLLVDNGTVGRYGADIILRKRFEEFLSKQTIENSGKRIPVVCVVLEGGTCTIRAVLDYITNQPAIPVVVCDGSGRAADLIAFAQHYLLENGELAESIREQLVSLIQDYFGYSRIQAEKVYMELLLCVRCTLRKKHLITIFRLGEDNNQDIDHAILTALLKGQDLSAADQLSLTLTWNRVDIARSDILVYGHNLLPSLNDKMKDALIYDRVDFVKLLLENGVSMQQFLTFDVLEELYNADKGPAQSADALRLIVQDVVKYSISKNHKFSLQEVGLVIQKLMGGAYRANYCRKDFRKRLKEYRDRKAMESMPFAFPMRRKCSQSQFALLNAAKPFLHQYREFQTKPGANSPLLSKSMADEEESPESRGELHFKYPFNELLIWAVLMRRQQMALLMWQHGEEAMAKALVATRLYKTMAKEAAEDYLEVEICDELNKYADEFRKLAFDLLEHCYNTDDDLTYQLLTYELSNWGKQTCLSLAAMANHKEFLAHPGCQILLADLWHGGLRIRRNSNLKVLLGLLCPVFILTLDFKTKDELLLQPQTKEEHIEDIRDDMSSIGSNDPDSDNDGRSSVSSLNGDSSDSETSSPNTVTTHRHKTKRQRSRNSTLRGSQFSLNFIRNIPNAVHKKSITKQHVVKSPLNHGNNNLSLQAASLPSRGLAGFDRPSSVREQIVEKDAEVGDGSKSERGSSVLSRISTLLAKKHSKDEGFPNDSSDNLLRQATPLKLGKKFYEFYVAPITTFWSFTISYVWFLILFTYIVLVRTPEIPSWPEIYVMLFVFTYGCELLRKFLMTEPLRISEKLKLFTSQRWNVTCAFAVIMFFVAIPVRLNPSTLPHGRVMYSCDIVYWYIQVLHLMSILGPYITMVGRMVTSMCYICTILTVVLMSFGLVRQSILFPNEDWHWQLVRNIFYKPYFMLYGEVYAPEIDTCGDDGINCVVGGWLTPAFMAAFLLVANILLINLIIAVFNNIFSQINSISQEVWKFRRYYVVMEYEQKPFLPPPLITITHVYLLYKYFCWRAVERRAWIADFGLKLFLNDENVEKLHDFEEECMDELFHQKEITKMTATDERVRKTADRVEFLSMKLDDLNQKHQLSKTTLDSRLKSIEDNLVTIVRALQNLPQVSPVVEQVPTSPFSTGFHSPTLTEHSRQESRKRSHQSGANVNSETEAVENDRSPSFDAVEAKSSDASKKVNYTPIQSAKTEISKSSKFNRNPHRLHAGYRVHPSPVASPSFCTRGKRQMNLKVNTQLTRNAHLTMASPRRGSIHAPGHPLSPLSPRLPRHAEYTSITDCIDTSDVEAMRRLSGPQSSVSNDFLTVPSSASLTHCHFSLPSPAPNDTDDNFHTITEVRNRGASQDDIQRQRGDGTLSHKKEDIGEYAFELSQYLANQQPIISSAVSSSQESLHSTKLEDKEGFEQINEFLVTKELDKIRRNSHQPLTDSANVQKWLQNGTCTDQAERRRNSDFVSTKKQVSRQNRKTGHLAKPATYNVLMKRSLSSSEVAYPLTSMEQALSNETDVNQSFISHESDGTVVSDSSKVARAVFEIGGSCTSLLNTPVRSSKAGLVFTFDDVDIKQHLRHVDPLLNEKCGGQDKIVEGEETH